MRRLNSFSFFSLLSFPPTAFISPCRLNFRWSAVLIECLHLSVYLLVKDYISLSERVRMQRLFVRRNYPIEDLLGTIQNILQIVVCIYECITLS